MVYRGRPRTTRPPQGETKPSKMRRTTPPREMSSGWDSPTHPEDKRGRPAIQAFPESREEQAELISGGVPREAPGGHALCFHALL